MEKIGCFNGLRRGQSISFIRIFLNIKFILLSNIVINFFLKKGGGLGILAVIGQPRILRI